MGVIRHPQQMSARPMQRLGNIIVLATGTIFSQLSYPAHPDTPAETEHAGAMERYKAVVQIQTTGMQAVHYWKRPLLRLSSTAKHMSTPIAALDRRFLNTTAETTGRPIKSSPAPQA